MKSITKLANTSIIMGLLLLVSACGGSKTKIKLVMENSATLIHNFSDLSFQKSMLGVSELFGVDDHINPTKFEMKIVAAYVVEDIDPGTSDNVGEVGMVWLNDGCGGTINGCGPSDIDYSDLTDPTAFNAELNSQALSIDAGTYRYARLEFCQGSAGSSNVKVTHEGTATEFTYSGCGVTSAELSEPITLRDGDSLSLKLTYNLNNGTVYCADGDANDSCAGEVPLLGSIDLVPSIVQ